MNRKIDFTWVTVIALIVTLFTGASRATVLLLSFGQIAMLVQFLRQRDVTGAGAFIFMSTLFFGIRPLYLIFENDTLLFDQLFLIVATIEDLSNASWWGTLAMVCFGIGANFAKKCHHNKWRLRFHTNKKLCEVNFKEDVTGRVILCQIISLGIMFALAKYGRMLYGSALGAYIYDLPVLLQAANIFGVSLIFERYMRNRKTEYAVLLGISLFILLFMTYLMRDISIFRSFYLSGLLGFGITVVARLRKYVRPYWLVAPFVLVLPIFQTLGQTRTEGNDALTDALSEKSQVVDRSFISGYWHFYEASGDMNIYDTFVAAMKSKPIEEPYIMSWLYVPFHLVPRALWPDKPKNGTLQDMTFCNGAPYCPGVAGFFLLDGGKTWMLGCMAFLGYLIGYLDWTIITMRKGVLRNCLYGAVVVYGMLLSRLFLWQYFYSMLYFLVPCIIFYKITKNPHEPMKDRRTNSTRRSVRRNTNSIRTPITVTHE